MHQDNFNVFSAESQKNTPPPLLQFLAILQAQLAARLGTTQQNFSKYEKTGRMPIDRLIALAAELGVPVCYMWGAK